MNYGQLVSPTVTCAVAWDDNGIIIAEGTAPIVSKFIGQPIDNLKQWAMGRLAGIVVADSRPNIKEAITEAVTKYDKILRELADKND